MVDLPLYLCILVKDSTPVECESACRGPTSETFHGNFFRKSGQNHLFEVLGHYWRTQDSISWYPVLSDRSDSRVGDFGPTSKGDLLWLG